MLITDCKWKYKSESFVSICQPVLKMVKVIVRTMVGLIVFHAWAWVEMPPKMLQFRSTITCYITPFLLNGSFSDQFWFLSEVQSLFFCSELVSTIGFGRILQKRRLKKRGVHVISCDWVFKYVKKKKKITSLSQYCLFCVCTKDKIPKTYKAIICSYLFF